MTALITGAGTGIGRAVAEKFLSEGFHVALVGRRPELLREMESRYPGFAKAFPCDITKPSDVRELARALKADSIFGGQLSVLVNNAGIFERKAFSATDDEGWANMFEVNLFGAVRITRELLPLLAKNRGVIVNVSSTLGLRAMRDTTAYSASKAAMISWTQGLAIEVASEGVRANCVCPGIVDTPIHSFHGQGPAALAALSSLQPLGRVGQPSDVAHAVYSLSGKGSEWITGAVLSVDGGIGLV